MLTLSNKKVKRESNLKSALIIIALLASLLIPVLIWGDMS